MHGLHLTAVRKALQEVVREPEPSRRQLLTALALTALLPWSGPAQAAVELEGVELPETVTV
jgi:hypothetical protein